MTIELLYFEGCPNWRVADARLATIAAERWLAVQHRQITTPAEAAAAGFGGSPTILADGRDPFATGDEPSGLSCRIYQTPDGPDGSPTLEQLRSVLGA